MTPVVLRDSDVVLWQGDVRQGLAALPDRSVDCVVTSPPYYGLRDYGVDGQLGLEPSPEAFLSGLVDVFREIRRVLADHGSLWVNLGDSYANDAKWGGSTGGKHAAGLHGPPDAGRQRSDTGLPPKSLLGLPWRLALALQADGWLLRRDVIWAKPNPMPESAVDRPTTAHEYVFMLTKRGRYFYDFEASRERARYGRRVHGEWRSGAQNGDGHRSSSVCFGADPEAGRNGRSVWEIGTEASPEAHFATFPRELVRRAIVAGCALRVCRVCGKASLPIVESERGGVDWRSGDRLGKGKGAEQPQPSRGRRTIGWTICGHGSWRRGVVLDPFVGTGTTCRVARDLGRDSIGIDLSADYLQIAARKLAQLSLLSEVPA